MFTLTDGGEENLNLCFILIILNDMLSTDAPLFLRINEFHWIFTLAIQWEHQFIKLYCIMKVSIQ